jgi:hypothetical protein
MIAIGSVGVVMNAAVTVIIKMSYYNKNYCKGKEPELVLVPYLFANQQ